MDDPNWDQRKRLKDMLQVSWQINEKVDIGVNKQLNVKIKQRAYTLSESSHFLTRTI